MRRAQFDACTRGVDEMQQGRRPTDGRQLITPARPGRFGHVSRLKCWIPERHRMGRGDRVQRQSVGNHIDGFRNVDGVTQVDSFIVMFSGTPHESTLSQMPEIPGT